LTRNAHTKNKLMGPSLSSVRLDALKKVIALEFQLCSNREPKTVKRCRKNHSGYGSDHPLIKNGFEVKNCSEKLIKFDKFSKNHQF
jgi:hypothetical protein